MQVTDEMVEAAAMRLWYGVEPPALYGDRAPREALRDAIQAALDAMPKATGGVITDPGPLPRAGCYGEGYLMPEQLPDLPAGTIVVIHPSADATEAHEALDRLLRMNVRSEAATSQHQIAVTEPRPGSTIDDIAAVIGHHRQVVLEWIADRDLGRSRLRFPEPVVTTGDVERDLYDLDAVKAWYDALPQAADG